MGWLHRLFGDAHAPIDDTLEHSAAEAAKTSEEALKEARSALNALEQIKAVEDIVRDHR